MDSFWANFAIEIVFLSLLGVLYYFWQKRRILSYEKEKPTILMGQLLQSCLIVRGDNPNPKLDALIEALDDFIHNKSTNPPTALIRIYADSPECDPELKNVMQEILAELAQ